MNYMRLLIISTAVFISVSAAAQDVSEAYNLSNLSVQGTARSMGFGNALGSVGGDPASMGVNPAGIGIYRTNELTITPSLKLNNAAGTFLGNTNTVYTTVGNINNFSLVFTNAPKGRRYEHRNWKTVSFGISMNKMADFSHDYYYRGTNRTSSATQAFESDANLNPGNDSLSGTLGFMGYQTFLTNDSTNGNYYTAVPFSQGIVQEKSVTERGGINEWELTLGGNYKEKLMLGVTLGLPNVNYTRNATYSEIYNGNGANPSGFSSFNYQTNLSISGAGMNLKIGAIYKITQGIRIGAAFSTPTYYTLTDVLNYTLASNVGNNSRTLTTFGDIPADIFLSANNFNYSFTTPWKGILSATILLKTPSRALGFITADYEFVNYSTMHYSFPSGYDNSTGASFQQEQTQMNNAISNLYHAASNFRVGAEILLTKYFMVRGGFGFYGNPYTASTNMNGQRTDISAGIGYHFEHFYVDFGLVHSMYKSYEQPYSIDFSGVYSGPAVAIPVASIQQNINNVALTLGYKFYSKERQHRRRYEDEHVNDQRR